MPLIPPHLTPREAEIMVHILRGLSNKEIAAVAGLSIAGVKHILARMQEKLGVSSRVGLIQAWMEFVYRHRLDQVNRLANRLNELQAELGQMRSEMQEGWLTVRPDKEDGDYTDNQQQEAGAAEGVTAHGSDMDRYDKDAGGGDGEGGGGRPPNRPADY